MCIQLHGVHGSANIFARTGADIAALVKEAGMNAIRESLEADIVTQAHFNEALKKVGEQMRREKKFFD